MNKLTQSEEFLETDATDAVADGEIKADAADIPEQDFEIDETYWGYVIRNTQRTSSLVLVVQFFAWFAGITFGAAALGLWVMPGVMFNGDVFAMKMGASVFLSAVAIFFLWFASRGAKVELQVDTRLAELREVVRNRTGRSTLVGRYGFDAIGGVFLERNMDAETVKPKLVLRYRNTSQLLTVASGLPALLEPLRDRLGRDLMLGGEIRTA